MYIPVKEFQSQQRKSFRIVQALNGVAVYGHLYCKKEHHEFVTQFIEYSPLFTGHDDLIDAVAIGVDDAMQELNVIEGDFSRDDGDTPLDNWRACP